VVSVPPRRTQRSSTGNSSRSTAAPRQSQARSQPARPANSPPQRAQLRDLHRRQARHSPGPRPAGLLMRLRSGHKEQRLRPGKASHGPKPAGQPRSIEPKHQLKRKVVRAVNAKKTVNVSNTTRTKL
jgi:hypothetical protein